MPKNRLKRPRDPAQLAKLMIDIASGQVILKPIRTAIPAANKIKEMS